MKLFISNENNEETLLNEHDDIEELQKVVADRHPNTEIQWTEFAPKRPNESFSEKATSLSCFIANDVIYRISE